MTESVGRAVDDGPRSWCVASRGTVVQPFEMSAETPERRRLTDCMGAGVVMAVACSSTPARVLHEPVGAVASSEAPVVEPAPDSPGLTVPGDERSETGQLTLHRAPFEPFSTALRDGWREAVGEEPCSAARPLAWLGPDGRRLAISVSTIAGCKRTGVLMLFDLHDPAAGHRTIFADVGSVAFSPSGRYFATFGHRPTQRYRTFDLWNLAMFGIVGTRRLPLDPLEPGQKRGAQGFANQRSLAHDGGRGTFWVGPSGFGGTFRMIDDVRVLANARYVWSFQLAGGEHDWYPDALIFGRGGEDGAIGDGCLVTTEQRTARARVYDAQLEEGGPWFELPELAVQRSEGARVPRLMTSSDCLYVAVVSEATSIVYATGSGQRVLELAAGDGNVHLLRKHLVTTVDGDVQFHRLSDGSPVALHVTGSPAEQHSGQIRWTWIEPPRQTAFAPVGVEIRSSYRFDVGDEVPPVILWTGESRMESVTPSPTQSAGQDRGVPASH